MNSLFDERTGEEFRLGPDGRYYSNGVGYTAKAGDMNPAAPAGMGGRLVPTPPNTGTLPTHSISAINATMGQRGTEHRMLAGRMVHEVSRGRARADRVIENLIKITSPLQVVQQGVMDAFMDYVSTLENVKQDEVQGFLEKFDADPLYTVDVMMSDIAKSPSVSEATRNEIYSIAARYNFSIPNA